MLKWTRAALLAGMVAAAPIASRAQDAATAAADQVVFDTDALLLAGAAVMGAVLVMLAIEIVTSENAA